MVAPPFSGKNKFIISLREQVEEISCEQSQYLYTTISSEDAIKIWKDSAEPELLNKLKDSVVILKSDKLREMMCVALLFARKMTRKDFQWAIESIIKDQFVRSEFMLAISAIIRSKTVPKLVILVHL